MYKNFFSKAPQKIKNLHKNYPNQLLEKKLTSMTAFTQRTIKDFYPVVFRNSQLVSHMLSDSLLVHYLPYSLLDLYCMNLFLLKKITNWQSHVLFCSATTVSRFQERCLTFKANSSQKIMKRSLNKIQTTKIRPTNLVQSSKT